MKLSCLQENLARGLAIVGRAVATRSTLPVLSNILLSTNESRLKLSATNLEISIISQVNAMVETEGAITVPARLLADFVNSLPNDKIQMELTTRTRTLHLRSGSFEADIRGIDAQEFPLILIPEEDHAFPIPAQGLREMIDRTVFAAATDESRPVLTGVYAEIKADRMTMAAADSYRLSVASCPLEQGSDHPVNVLIPARALQELGRVIGDEKTVTMLISSNRNQVFFRLENVDLVSQLVEGSFPDYRQIIPTASSTQTRIVTTDFQQAVRTASIFARDAANIIRLQVVPQENAVGRLIVSADSAEHGNSTSQLDVTVKGAPIDIAFNARYLMDALNAVNTGEVIIETRDPSSPGVIKMPDSDRFVHIIMPMHVAR